MLRFDNHICFIGVITLYFSLGFALHLAEPTIDFIKSQTLTGQTPVLLSKQGLCMGSYFRRGLTLEQPNDRDLHTPRKKLSLGIYTVACQRGGVSNKPPWLQAIAPGSDETQARDPLKKYEPTMGLFN